MDLHTQIIKSLLKIIPKERGFKLSEEAPPYSSDLAHLLDHPPMANTELASHAPRTTHHAPRTTHHASGTTHHASPPA